MVGVYDRALPYKNSLKKGWEEVNIFLVWMVHKVTFKGEDYIIDACWLDISIMSGNMILMSHMALSQSVDVTMIMHYIVL